MTDSQTHAAHAQSPTTAKPMESTPIDSIDDPIDMTGVGFPRTPEADMALYMKGFFTTGLMMLRQLLVMKGENIPAPDRKRIEDAMDRMQIDAPNTCNGIARHMTSPEHTATN